jgi:UDP-3-O-[3-hydroxymyristoyl] glucosamine N-acyltransferase
MKLSELAQVSRAEIDGVFEDIEISGAAGLDEAEPGQVTFLANPRYTPKVKTTRASAIFVRKDATVGPSTVALRADDPYLAYTRALRALYPEPAFKAFIHPTSIIDPSAIVSEDVQIGAHVVIEANASIERGVRLFPNVTIYEGVRVGEDSVLHSGVAIREGSVLGKRVIVHNNSVIGADGFGFAKDEQGRWLKIPQTGRVVIEDDVEIGACSTIDRASVGETRISRGVKIDNLVQVGHSCEIGDDSLICAQVGLAGSSRVGKKVILAGQVGIAGHMTVGDGAIMIAQSGTFRDIPPGKVMSGVFPAIDHRESLKVMAAFPKLPAMQRSVRNLEERIAALEAKETITTKG